MNMPLSICPVGEENIIKRVGGRGDLKRHLKDLGFVAGETVKIIADMGGNIIVNVKETRIAVSREMASKIMV